MKMERIKSGNKIRNGKLPRTMATSPHHILEEVLRLEENTPEGKEGRGGRKRKEGRE